MTLRMRILNAQNGDSDELFAIVQDFRPLLQKLSRRLIEEDTYAELQFKLIETVLRIRLDRLRSHSDPTLISYLSKSINNYFFFLCKQEQINRMIQPISSFEKDSGENEPSILERLSPPQIDRYISDDIDYLRRYLTPYETTVVFAFFYFKYTVSEIAAYFGVSLSAVSQAKKNALLKLRKAVLDDDDSLYEYYGAIVPPSR